MPVPAEKQKSACQRFAKRFFAEGVTATMDSNDLIAALNAVYDAFDALASDLVQDQTVQANILAVLSEPFKSRSTAEQKGWIGMTVLAIRSGIL